MLSENFFQPKQLNGDEETKLKKQQNLSEFNIRKLELEARRNWDRFYKRNSDNFFKDRTWTKTDLEEILSDLDLTGKLVFFEAGCGVGNTLFPIAKYFPHWTLCGVDFSKNAVEMLNARATDENFQIQTAVVDLTEDINSDSIQSLHRDFPKVDVISLIFVLSSIAPPKQTKLIENLKALIKPGGCIVVRDYGVYDHAMLRFGRGTKIHDRFYTRHDGTRAYFFYIEELTKLFEERGFRSLKCEYLYRKTTNHLKNLSVDRIFLQGRFIL